MECSTDNGKISIKIPIDIPQMPDKEYDIIFDYKYQIGDMIPPELYEVVAEILVFVNDLDKLKAKIDQR